MPPFSGSPTTNLQYAVGTWTLAGATTAGFSVGNFVTKRVSGTIPVTSAQVEIAEDGAVRSAAAVLDFAAIDTGHAKRDSDLAKPGLLDLADHPTLVFTASQVLPAADGCWEVTGLLTVKGTTQQITLDASAQPAGDVIRVRLTGQLDRRAFGIRAPGFLIGKLVDIEIDAGFRRG